MQQVFQKGNHTKGQPYTHQCPGLSWKERDDWMWWLIFIIKIKILPLWEKWSLNRKRKGGSQGKDEQWTRECICSTPQISEFLYFMFPSFHHGHNPVVGLHFTFQLLWSPSSPQHEEEPSVGCSSPEEVKPDGCLGYKWRGDHKTPQLQFPRIIWQDFRTPNLTVLTLAASCCSPDKIHQLLTKLLPSPLTFICYFILLHWLPAKVCETTTPWERTSVDNALNFFNFRWWVEQNGFGDSRCHGMAQEKGLDVWRHLDIGAKGAPIRLFQIQSANEIEVWGFYFKITESTTSWQRRWGERMFQPTELFSWFDYL